MFRLVDEVLHSSAKLLSVGLRRVIVMSVVLAPRSVGVAAAFVPQAPASRPLRVLHVSYTVLQRALLGLATIWLARAARPRRPETSSVLALTPSLEST